MRTGLNCITCSITLLLFVPSFGADGPPSGGASLFQSCQAVKVLIVQGRLTIDPSHYCKVRREQLCEKTGHAEFLCVSASQGLPALHYSSRTPQGRVTVDIAAANAIFIEQIIHTSSRHCELQFRQDDSGEMSLKVTADKRPTVELFATSLWHLYAQNPDVCEQWLTPLLKHLVVDFQPLETLAQVNASLQAGFSQVQIRRSYVIELVAQLGSPVKAERSAAQSELVEMGVGVLPMLDQIPSENLDGEQLRRIGTIRNRLRSYRSDSPQSVAQWLSVDFGYCSAIAASLPPADRVALNSHLVTTCERSLPANLLLFDDQPAIRVAHGDQLRR